MQSKVTWWNTRWTNAVFPTLFLIQNIAVQHCAVQQAVRTVEKPAGIVVQKTRAWARIADRSNANAATRQGTGKSIAELFCIPVGQSARQGACRIRSFWDKEVHLPSAVVEAPCLPVMISNPVPQ
jgi:hypothetical protein